MEVSLSVVGAWRSCFQTVVNLSFLEWCCEPPCERPADAILHKQFHQQFDLHSVVLIFQINRGGWGGGGEGGGQSLFLPLECFAAIVCESG